VKRVAGILAVLLAGVAVVVSLVGASASGSSTYRVDGIFDTAKGIIPGELVEIAGARVGTVKDVVLYQDKHGTYQARIEMDVDGKYGPFHRNATCKIKPVGLIAENFVQCDPGTASAPALKGNGKTAPFVPVSHTSVPVNLLDLFNIFNTPVADRLSLAVSELGIGLAGNGENLNSIIRRANPTLALTRRALGILDAQKHQVTQIVDASDQLVGRLAKSKGRVQDFVDSSASVLRQTGDHSSALADAIRRLPGLLQAANPALDQLDSVATTSIPIVRNVHAAAPAIRQILSITPQFARSAVPAFTSLGKVAKKGIATAKNDAPKIKELRQFTARSLPLAQQFDELMVNLRQRGFWDYLLSFGYNAAAATARYDNISHILPAHVNFSPCSLYATAPTAGCSANFGTATTTAATTTARSHRSTAGSSPATTTSSAAPSTTNAAPAAPTAPTTTTPQQTQPPTISQVLQSLTNFLLK
jgi:virulence factor Mce-like protein